jgi:hypothetical protein
VELFGSTRDDWIKEDLAGWLAPNRIYDGVPVVLNRLLQQAELYIVTTKQARNFLSIEDFRQSSMCMHIGMACDRGWACVADVMQA